MKSFSLGFFFAVVILPLGVGAYFRLGLADAQSDVPPPAWESRLMTLAVRHSVSKRAGTLPVASIVDEERIVKGGKLYMLGCAGCHGELGKPLVEDHSLFPRVPQLPHRGTEYTEPQIYWIVKHGIRMTAMSAYGRFYSEEELRSIAAFLRQVNNLSAGTEAKILAKSTHAAP